MKPLIVVSGKNGQLGWELQQIAAAYPHYDFIFCDKKQLDITNFDGVQLFFSKNRPAVFINCAAYTAVDKAEAEQEAAYTSNAQAVGFLASQCSLYNTLFITYSTDYVFNGKGQAPYKENEATAPLNYYGYTKEQGEKLALANWHKTIIVRTSWVYSSHGHNFVKTMLRLMKERSDINVVNDQLGCPTYAKDLALATMQIIEGPQTNYGIFHFCNQGIISWFEFATAIKELAGLECIIHPVPASGFATVAKRPAYSALNTTRIVEAYPVVLKNWKQSLAVCIGLLNEKSGS